MSSYWHLYKIVYIYYLYIYLYIYIYIYTLHYILYRQKLRCDQIALVRSLFLHFYFLFQSKQEFIFFFSFHCRRRPQNLLSSSTSGRYSSIHLLVRCFGFFSVDPIEIEGATAERRFVCRGRRATDGGLRSKGAFCLLSSMSLLSFDVGTYFLSPGLSCIFSFRTMESFWRVRRRSFSAFLHPSSFD